MVRIVKHSVLVLFLCLVAAPLARADEEKKGNSEEQKAVIAVFTFDGEIRESEVRFDRAKDL